MTIGERIKKVRKTLDFTQQEFANRLGTKQNTVATYEMGRTNPSSLAINNICREFNVNETWLRTGEGEMFNKQSAEDELSHMVNQLMTGETAVFKKRLIAALSSMKEDQWGVLEFVVNKILAEREEQTTEAPPPPKEPDQLILEQEADAFAAKAREQFLLAKKRESQASSVKKSDVG